MNGIKEEVFNDFKTMIRGHLQDADNEQFKELQDEWKTQRDVRRTILAAKLKSKLSVGDKTLVEGVTYTVTKINKVKFVGKHPDTNVHWTIPINMIEEIL